MKRKFMSKNVNIRDLLENADKKLYKKRSNDPECPFFQFLPKEKNTRYNLRNTSVWHSNPNCLESILNHNELQNIDVWLGSQLI